MELFALARNPVPSGAVVGRFKGHDGCAIRFARFEATRGPRRGTVCIFTGRTEFIEKYFEVIADLRRRGFAVAIMDLRGQGGSGRALINPAKGHVKNFRQYDQDLATFMTGIVLPSCPGPHIGLGHSLGGHLLLRHASQAKIWFQRIVVTAPMIELSREASGLSQQTMRLLSETLAAVGFARAFVPGGSRVPQETMDFETNIVTSDRERYMRTRAILEAAPELALGSPTIGWLRAALRSMAMLQGGDYPSTIKVPSLLVAAGQDRIVSTNAVEAFGVSLKVG